LKPIFDSYIQLKDVPILIVGCGNSELAEELKADGYQTLHNIDYSEVVISQMNQRVQDLNLQGIEYRVMDACQMSFNDATYKFVIDKGTLDAIMCGDNANEVGEKMLKEISRVLASGGVFILISCMPRGFVWPLLNSQTLGWKIFRQTTIHTNACFIIKK